MTILAALLPLFVGAFTLTHGGTVTDAARWRELDRVIPLGIEPAATPAGTAPPPAGSLAAFQVQVSLPGGVTDALTGQVIHMAIESERVIGGATGQTPSYLPPAHLRQTSPSGVADARPVSFALRHDVPSTPAPAAEGLRFQRGWNRMVSPWIVAIADPRAAKDYEWGTTLSTQQKADRGCYSCERPSFIAGTLGTDWYELYTAGRVISVRPERCASPGPTGCASSGSIFSGTEYSYLGEAGRLERRISTVMADTVRPTQVLTAAQGAPVAVGAHQETVLVHSGEVMTGTVDLDAGGRAGWNVVFDRTYRSRTLGITPLGAGWDSSNFQRLRALPNLAVEYRDGSGETWRFTPDSAAYKSPVGLDLRLARHRNGWRMTDMKQRITEFDELGRMVMQADEFYDIVVPGKGNVISYSYDAEGRLKRIVDPVGRTSTLTYEDDRLTKVLDWREREVLFHYDASALLKQAELPRTRGVLGFDYTSDSTRPKQNFKYLSAGTAYSEQLELGTNLEHIREPGDTEDRVSFEYEASGEKRDMVKSEVWHTVDNARSTFEYTLAAAPALPVASETIVHDALDQKRTYTLNAATAPKNYFDDRVHTEKLVEASVPSWTVADFGTLPLSVTTASYNNDEKDRTWKFEYIAGRLESTRLMKPGSTSEVLVDSDYGWQVLAGFPGAVLQSREVTSTTGALGLAQSYGHNGAFLASVTSGLQTIETPEPRRDALTPAPIDGGVKRTTTFADDGQVKSVIAAAVLGSEASGEGAETTIDRYLPDDSIKHRRAMPSQVKEGADFDIKTEVKYDTTDPDVVTLKRVGRNYDTRKEYDQMGRVIRVAVTGTDVDTEDVFAYDARGRLVRQRTKQDAGKYVEQRYQYDLVGRMTAQETYEGASSPSTLLSKTSTTYNLPNLVTRTTLPTNGEITTTLDSLGRVQDRVTDPKNPAFMGSITIMTERTRYDVQGNVVYQSDDQQATATRYDAVHRPVETLHADGTRTKTTFDGFGRVTKVEDTATGQTVTNEYTSAGKLKKTTTNTSVHQFAWDGAGRTNASTSTAAGAPEQRTEAEFDDAGRLLEEKSGEGLAGTMVREYDGTTWNYGGSDQVSTVTSRENGGAYTVDLTNDAFGRATKVTSAASDMNVEQAFDAIGNVTEAKTPGMRGRSEYGYDGRGLVTEEKLPGASGGAAAVKQHQYDANGLLKNYLDPTGEATRTERDGLGRPFRRTYEDDSTEEIHYDQWRVSKIKDRQNRWQYFGYDTAGRLETITSDGVELDRLTYDAEGRLIRWKTPESLLELGSFDAESRPQLTRQIRNRADGTPIDDYQQSHSYDGFGRRRSWTMPGTAALTTGPWAMSVSPRYDAAGNIVQLDRAINGLGLTTLLTSDYRTAGRPKHRTLRVNAASASPIEIRREYDYESVAGRMTAFRVFSGGQLMAGSEMTFEGTLRKTARLLGLSNGERNTSFDYDDRGRLRASAAASTNPLAALMPSAPETVVPELNDADFLEAIKTSGGTSAAPSRTFNETIDGHKIKDAGNPAEPFQYKKADGTDGGALRTRDARFEYEFDQKERLRKVTQRLTGGESFVLRVVYSYSGAGRMIGRRMEIAPVAGGVMPADSAFVLARPDQLGPDAGLPASTTFVWDPISDQLVAVFEAETVGTAGAIEPSGRLLRQFLHGGLGLDDPIEVTVAEETGVTRYYPIYDEAGDGGLQAILNETGRIVTRTILTNPYGDGEATIAGPAVENVTVTPAANNGVEIDIAFTEPIDEGTLATGVRLAAASTAGTVTSTATPTLVNNGTTVRWTLTQTQWTELSGAAGAQALSVAVTSELRSRTFADTTPILAGDTTQSGVSTSTAVPFAVSEPFSQITARLASGSTPIALYHLTSIIPTSAVLAGSSSVRFGQITSQAVETADSAALLLLAAPFQAQSFMDPFTLKNYVRARWYDPSTGSFLTPDPSGYADSSNLYAFAGGDPVNGRDPTGRLCEAANASGLWDWVKRCGDDVNSIKSDFEAHTAHDVLNLVSLGTLERVENQKNLGTMGGIGESLFNGARSFSNAASFGLQDAIYETQMREGPGIRSIGNGVSLAAYDLLPMEETRALIQDGDRLSAPEKVRLVFSGISKSAGVLLGAKGMGQAGAARYYRSRVTSVYQRAVQDYSSQGLRPDEVGNLADRATKRWSSRHLSDFEQMFDPETARYYENSVEGARPDVLLPSYGEGIEFKKTFGTAWRAQDQFGKFVDLFPEYNIEYVLGDGGWVSPSGTPIIKRAYGRSVAATAPVLPRRD